VLLYGGGGTRGLGDVEEEEEGDEGDAADGEVDPKAPPGLGGVFC